MSKTDIHKKAMIDALTKSLGIVTIACKEVGIARQQHYFWMQNDSDYKKAVDDISDVALDFAESMLHQQMKDKDTAATIFYLKTKGKRRGYIERHDITSDDKPIGGINITVTDPKIGEELKKLLK